MKVKVGNKIYDPNEEPVMVILDEEDKKNIAAMTPDASKYCAFPDSMNPEEVSEWLKDFPSVNADLAGRSDSDVQSEDLLS